MEAAHITWRPLGQLFVERGLISQEELEDALVEQRETRKRLGSILVGRGLVSGPELTSVLVDQLGMELTKESGFGSGLWDEIRRRHPRGRDRIAPAAAGESGDPGELEDPAPAPPAARHQPEPEPELQITPVPEAPAAAQPLRSRLEEDLERERAALAAALAEEHAELESALTVERDALAAALEAERSGRQQTFEELTEVQAALTAERNAVQAALDEERTAREQALEELVQARDDLSGHADELELLRREVDELRLKAEDTRSAADEEQARRGLEALAERVAVLEGSLESERQVSARASDELEGARTEAGIEARELRSSIERVRTELERLDAATAWFEYWSGAATGCAKAEEPRAQDG